MTKVVFSADTVSNHLGDHARFRSWVDLYTSQICAADFSLFPDRPSHAHSEFLPFGNICGVKVELSVKKFVRRSSHIARDGRDDCLIGVARNDSRNRLEQRGWEVELRKGQPYFVLTGEPIAQTYDSEIALSGVAVPRKILAERVAGLSSEPSLLNPTPAWRHLDRYLSMLMSAEIENDPALLGQIETHIIDLVALALGARGESAELASARGLRAARLREVIAQIERGFGKASFATDDIASAMGLSRRYINDLLHETGVTFFERVLELRLQKARAMLSDARYDRAKVSDIALACGFSEVSYFNRRFRARFGCSPTQYRGRAD